MPGIIAIVIVLFLIPVMVIVGGAIASVIIGEVFYRDGHHRFANSELRDLPD